MSTSGRGGGTRRGGCRARGGGDVELGADGRPGAPPRTATAWARSSTVRRQTARSRGRPFPLGGGSARRRGGPGSAPRRPPPARRSSALGLWWSWSSARHATRVASLARRAGEPSVEAAERPGERPAAGVTTAGQPVSPPRRCGSGCGPPPPAVDRPRQKSQESSSVVVLYPGRVGLGRRRPL